MDKETLSHYGWIVIISLVLTVMIALATPFGKFVGQAVSNTVRGFAGTAQTKFDGSDFDADQFELDYNKDKQEWEYAKGGTIKREVGSVIPDGATYTKANGTTLNGNGTNTFPDTPQTGDTYEEVDYMYKYNQYYNGSYWDSSSSQNGWGVRVKDNSKTSYGDILSEIAGQPVKNMFYTFYNCTFLTTAPTIPSRVTNMYQTFYNCTSLTTAPAIPNSVTNMSYTFYGCTSLTIPPDMSNASSVTNMTFTFGGCTSLATAPTIPSRVTNMWGTFSGCTSLTGTIEVNANPTECYECFKSTQITGITGSCSQATKDALMATK